MTGIRLKQNLIFGGVVFFFLCVLFFYILDQVNQDCDGNDKERCRGILYKSHQVPLQMGKDADNNMYDINTGQYDIENDSKEKIQLSLVICGNRITEAIVMLKSAVMFTETQMHLHIFIEEDIKIDLLEEVRSWPSVFKRKLYFTFYPIAYPQSVNNEEWKGVYVKCSSLRVFFPEALSDLDAVMYADTDILFLQPLDNYWSLFKQFNSTQILAMTESNYMKITDKIPFYQPGGLNSGTALMNLTRMRSIRMSSSLTKYYQKYKPLLQYGEQDLYNIFFYYYPQMFYPAGCNWNFRDINCRDRDSVQTLVKCHEGVSFMHGHVQSFHNDYNLAFKAVYEAFENYELGTDMETGLVQEIQRRLSHPNLVNLTCTQRLLLPEGVTSTLRNSMEILP